MGAVLRGYQKNMHAEIHGAWNAGAQSVMMVMGTGCGKSVTGMSLVPQLRGTGVVQAHRAELISQLSLALAKEGVRHNIVAGSKKRRTIVDLHMEKLGRCYFDPAAPWSVESVDTAIRRKGKPPSDYVIVDEGHHVVNGNKWHRAIVDNHPNARSLLMTATPCRGDGKGLGAHTDGIVNKMVVGPGLGQAMAEGYLVEYDIKVPLAADLDMSDVEIGPSGEFNQKQASTAIRRSRKIIGDAVEKYKEFAWGKLDLVFAVDIEHARDMERAYRAAGVPVAVITGDDEEDYRNDTLRKFERREIWVVINVDLFDEGTDIPGVEVVQMCRPTASFGKFAQMIGRMLRLDIDEWLMKVWDTLSVADRRAYIAASRKPRALLLDHVGNVHFEYKIGDLVYRGPPEGFTSWSLERRNKRAPTDTETVPQRLCTSCFLPFERYYDACPHCGADIPEPDPAARGNVAHVDGNLYDYDPVLLSQMRAEVARIDASPVASGPNADHIRRAWYARQKAQHELRESIAAWAGKWHTRSDSENYKRFYYEFGIDVVGACSLGANDAANLRGKIDAKLAT